MIALQVTDGLSLRELLEIIQAYVSGNPQSPATPELLKEIGYLTGWLQDVTEMVLDELEGQS